jgi:trimeric autotransporter adhesin
VILRIVGRGFTPSSIVKLDGRASDTRWISPTELAANLTAQHTAKVGTFLITVETPAPGGGSSNPVEFIVNFK